MLVGGLRAEDPAPGVRGEPLFCEQEFVGGSDVDADVVVGVFGDRELRPVAFGEYQVLVVELRRCFVGGNPGIGEIRLGDRNPPKVKGVRGSHVGTGGVA